MKSAEHLFIFFKPGTKQENLKLRSAFQSQQWKFDKLLKQCKNKFAREQQQVLMYYAIQKLKSGKAAGIDRICNEILKQPLF